MIRRAIGAIIYKKNKFLLVHKTKIKNTLNGEPINISEWDILKGGVNKNEKNEIALKRELLEELGTSNFKIKHTFTEKIEFNFSKELSKQLGYKKQSTTIFLVEFLGEINEIQPKDIEISETILVDSEAIYEYLTHFETINFFKNLSIEKILKR